MPRPLQGDVWLADFNPARGHEQAGFRPAVIVSVDPYNRGPAGLVVVIPISSKKKGIPLHVEILPPDGGLNIVSFAMCDQIRTIAKDRLTRKLGILSSKVLEEVQDRLCILLGLG